MTVLDNVTGTRIKIMSSPAHKSMEQREEADIAVAAEDEHGSCCSGIDPNTLKALERITNSIVKFNVNRGAVGSDQRCGRRNCECEIHNEQVSGMFEFTDDLENCGCRCSVHLVGLPKDMVGKYPVRLMDLKLTTKTGRI